MTLVGGVSEGLRHRAVAPDLCIAPLTASGQPVRANRFGRSSWSVKADSSLVPLVASQQVSGLFGVRSSMTLTEL